MTSLGLLATLAALLVAPTAPPARDPTDCAGLVPAALPAPVEIDLGGGPGISCRVWSVDGGGALLLERSELNKSGLRVYAPDGTLRGTASVSAVEHVWGQASGFVVRREESGPSSHLWRIEAVGVSEAGAVLDRSVVNDGALPPFAVKWVEDPRGGMVLLEPRVPSGTPSPWLVAPAASWELWLRRISATGATVQGPQRIDAFGGAPQEISGAVTNDGSIVAFLKGDALSAFRNNHDVGRWFDPGAVARTPWFLIFDQSVGYELFAFGLPDGSLFLGNGALAPRAQTVSPAPAWAASLSLALTRVLPDRIAQVLLESSSSPSCDRILEVRAPAGNVCGTLPLCAAPPGPDRAALGWPQIGRDGTVLLESVDGNRCRVRVWPGLLRAP